VSSTQRSILILVAVILAGVALAAVVVTRSHGGTTTLGTAAGGNSGPAVLSEAPAEGTASAPSLADIDPAKAEPTLDKFHSKDPFVQILPDTAAGGGGSATPAPGPSPSGAAVNDPTAADISVAVGGGSPVIYENRKVGAKLPPSNAVFQIADLTPSGADFTLLQGYQMPDGSSTFPAAEGETVKVILEKSGKSKTYYVKVLDLIYGGSSGGGGGGGGGSSGGGGGGSSTTAHSIRVVSIDSQNGVAACTLVVDGTTYANKQVGDTFSTGWGQIKILGINVAAQTVTILHGDQQVTLHVGQTVGK
jgi:hypothetical protein